MIDIRNFQQLNNESLMYYIREKYKTPSFFEMIDKTRSETSHSAFLRWILSGEGVSVTTSDSPVRMFLNLLVKRSMEQKSGAVTLMPKDVRDAILSRKIDIKINEIETEKRISELAELALETFDKSADKIHCTDLENIISSVDDKVDIVIDCDVKNCGNTKHLLVVIENKIDSTENGDKAKSLSKRHVPDSYSSLCQTERYRFASYHSDSSETSVIYVFINPKISTAELNSFPTVAAQLKKDWKCAQSNYYININYQDILNDVIDKLLDLNEGSITARTKMFLQEYKNEITFPHIEDPKKHFNIAYPSITGIMEFWKKYRVLFHYLVYSTVSNKSFAVVNEENIYKFSNDRICFSTADLVGKLFKGNSTKSLIFANTLKQKGYNVELIDGDALQASGVAQIFSDYVSCNIDILTTIFSDVANTPGEFSDEALSLREILLSGARDNMRYWVSYKDSMLTAKPVSKSEVVYLIFKQWQADRKASLLQMRETFPISINSYYSSGKYFQHLFYCHQPNSNYSYDGLDPRFGSNVPVTTNWDFYSDSVHQYGGITNLKMWRSDAFEALLAHLKKNFNTFYKDLEIIDRDGNKYNV